MDNKKEVEEKEDKKQLEEYSSLNIFQSRRGQVVLVFSGLYLLTFILSLFGLFELSDTLWSLIVYIPILIFVYKGHRWAMILLMILWIFEKSYTAYLAIENGNSIVGSILWLIFGISIIYKALIIENKRKKTLKSIESSNTPFCHNCGAKQETNTNFCFSCGTKII